MSARIIKFRNDSGETIPGRSFIKLDPAVKLGNNEVVYIAAKPDGGSGSVYIVSGSQAVANGAFGEGYDVNFGDAWVKHSGVATPVEEVGPADASWEMDEGGIGFHALIVDGDYTLIRGIGSGGGTRIVGFQITSIDRANRTAIVQITSRPVDGIVPGSGLGGTIIDSVCDVNGQWLNDASRIYIGDFGYAVYLDPGGATFCDEYNDGPHWEMLSLSCDGAECFDDL